MIYIIVTDGEKNMQFILDSVGLGLLSQDEMANRIFGFSNDIDKKTSSEDL